MLFRIQFSLLLLIVSILFPAIAVAQTFTAKVIRVIDGDTIKVNLQGQTESVRLIGIDTPECRTNEKAERDSERSGQDIAVIISQGRRATAFTRSKVKKGDTVCLETDARKRDRYQRILAYVWLSDGTMLNEAIVRAGYAQSVTYPPNVKYQAIFQEAAREAREAGRGLWR